MTNPEMTPVMTWDSVKHLQHVHWCDLEANSLKTCIAKAHHEHAMKWAGTLSRSRRLRSSFCCCYGRWRAR